MAGDAVPAGHYRFAIRTRALNLFSEQRGPTITDDFFVIESLAEGQFTAPIDAEVTTGDRIVVADGSGNRLQVIGFDGSVAQSVLGFSNPQDVAVSVGPQSGGPIYVVDTGADVEVFTTTGISLGPFGSGLDSPRALDVAADGSLWVKESATVAHLRVGDGGCSAGLPSTAR